ncbi:MAG: hypothetical protein JO141_05250 [Bradyrhizobium sp.]|nr:hypothetical protein [Bradyrhizobium sp.]
MIDSREASRALSDIDDMVKRVRQSRIYDQASQIAIISGALVFVGNIATYIEPGYAVFIWPTVNTLNVMGVAAISLMQGAKIAIGTFDFRILAAFVLFFAFGLLCSVALGHFGPREMGTFWPIYFMLFYCIAGLWFGRAFLVIGLTITVLTLIGYFFITSAAFLIWMAIVNGGGLIVSGLWMRWGE